MSAADVYSNPNGEEFLVNHSMIAKKRPPIT